MDFCTEMTGFLMKKQIEEDFMKNVVLSPLSFNAILNMTVVGCTGPTLNQMLLLLDSRSIQEINASFADFMSMAETKKNGDDKGPKISFLNGVWVTHKYPLQDSYQDLVQSLYKAQANSVDFSQVQEVVEEANAWAKSATNGLISEVLKEEHIKKETMLLLGNALYFKGSWKKPFKKESTTEKEFYLLNGDKIRAPFMTGCSNYSYKSFHGFQVAKIPYRSGTDLRRKFSMYIFLPDKKDGLKPLLERYISDPQFFKKHSSLGSGLADIFWIPKFKFVYYTEKAPEVMQKMGLTRPFDEKCEDITEIVRLDKGDSLHISAIIQKTTIEIDEEGSEAAAVTFERAVYGCCLKTEYVPPTEFVADHPFLFFIKEENSGFVLFAGAVLNPLSSE